MRVKSVSPDENIVLKSRKRIKPEKVRRLNKRAVDVHGEYRHFAGFSGTLTIPEEVVEHEGGFSILLSFDRWEIWHDTIR